jgi:hypothetical protein
MNGGGQVNNSAQTGGSRLSQSDSRQFTSEMQQRINEAQQLRDQLARQGTDVSELDRAMQEMRAAAAPENLKDEKSGAALRTQVIDGLKAYEFALRRGIDGKEGTQVLTGRTGDVPSEFKSYVEEYYRSIARPKPR